MILTYLKWGTGFVAALAGLLIVLYLTLGRANFLMLMGWIVYATAAAAVCGLIYLGGLLVTWHDKRRDEQHQAWYMQGAMVGVDVIRAALESEADRQTAMAKFGVEIVKVLKTAGVLESGSPPLFLSDQTNSRFADSAISGDYNVIHGLDEED